MKWINLNTALMIIFLLGIVAMVAGVVWWTPAFYVGIVLLAIGSLFQFTGYNK